jgi:hypothetical protein
MKCSGDFDNATCETNLTKYRSSTELEVDCAGGAWLADLVGA